MRIGFDGRFLNRPVKTGVEVYAEEIFKALVNLSQNDEIYLLSHDDRRNSYGPSVRCVRRRFRSRYLLPIFQVPGEIKRHRLDVFFNPGTYAYFGANRHTVFTVHDVAWRYWPDFFPASRRLALEYLLRYGLATSARIVAVSHHTKEDLIRLYGVPSERVCVIHHGYDPKLFNAVQVPGDNVELRRLGIDKRFILHVGTLQKRKDVPTLIRAFDRMKTKDVLLVLAGQPGWFYEATAHAVHNSRRRHEIIVTGYVPDATKATLLRRCSVFVSPSLYEGFGMPLVEAMAAGAPAVIAEASSLPEVAGDAALRFPPGDDVRLADHLDGILNDEGLLSCLSKKSLSRAQQFSWEKAAKALRAVICEVKSGIAR